jgi:hypothetical protein
LLRCRHRGKSHAMGIARRRTEAVCRLRAGAVRWNDDGAAHRPVPRGHARTAPQRGRTRGAARLRCALAPPVRRKRHPDVHYRPGSNTGGAPHFRPVSAAHAAIAASSGGNAYSRTSMSCMWRAPRGHLRIAVEADRQRRVRKRHGRDSDVGLDAAAAYCHVGPAVLGPGDTFAHAGVMGSSRRDGSDGWGPAKPIGRSLSHVHDERGSETSEARAAGAAHARIDDARRSAVEQALGERL